MREALAIICLASFFVSCTHQKKSSVQVFPVSKVRWEKLNPARGDKSPQAGTLWGDRAKELPTGFLVQFVDGFSSPPHIHNTSYRAIVIKGFVHNDDPKAASMWMPTGSYWTQPAGEPHITSAKGEQNMALVEIDKGPYLVKPVSKKFNSGEYPYNIHASNIIWKKNKGYNAVEIWADSDGRVTGSLIKIDSRLNHVFEPSKIVLIEGHILFREQSLKPGSFIDVKEKSKLNFLCKSVECILYLKN